MTKIGKFIAKHKYLILVISLILLVPSAIGYVKTRINYDILSYLPKTLETVDGQDIMVDEFGMGAFSMVVVEGMDNKDILKLEEKMEAVDHVEEVLWYGDAMDISVPTDMLPSTLKDALFNGDATLMIALFDDTTSSDDTMNAVEDLRSVVGKQCYISGMAGVVTDIKNLSIAEMPVYVAIAAVLSFLVLCLTMDSFFVPVLFLFSIGVGIVYNLGSNIFLGEISYITQALTAVLQLGVTMDYSIFLLSRYEENKKKANDRETAMADAIAATFTSVAGSSVTTVAGFAALMFMTFALGRDLGIVMIKGVIIGVICCVTLLPALILIFEKLIDKTTHKPLMPTMKRLSDFITRHHIVWLVVFLVMLVPAVYGNNNVKLYYNIDKGLPASLDSSKANEKLSKDFDMKSVYMVLLKDGLSSKEKSTLLNEIEDVKGVKWALGLDSVMGGLVPEDILPSDLRKTLQTDNYEIQFVCSDYSAATDEANAQIKKITKLVKSYNEESMVIGEAPLMKDLQDVTDVDLVMVNTVSIIAIFIIIMIVFKSISLPVILVAVIEFAICVNMAIPYYMGTELPFVASIVIGTIQLGATVDYAILMTSRYKAERMAGLSKNEAIKVAHRTSMKPVITSGISFFAATFGVGLYSSIDMISSITALLSRGAIISTVVVLVLLPTMFKIFDKVICYTTIGMRPKKD
ncbi:efflux RND transporter permease subunit [Lachnospiraceae bacterium HCP1S3_C3]|nr:efflux RND transporter permease subunit [Lachnospiraceae bacterium]